MLSDEFISPSGLPSHSNLILNFIQTINKKTKSCDEIQNESTLIISLLDFSFQFHFDT